MLNINQTQTHRESLEAFQNLQTVGMGTTFINVYRDAEGNTHYSSEEFSIGQDGIHSFDDALEEAHRLTTKYKWQYIRTLTGNEYYTDLMEIKLERLEKAKQVIQEFGGDFTQYHMDDLEDRAADLLSEDRVYGRV